jgi:hypothetical protein
MANYLTLFKDPRIDHSNIRNTPEYSRTVEYRITFGTWRIFEYQINNPTFYRLKV